MTFLRKNPFAVAVVALLIILPLAWWLLSPLFIDNAVSEPDPFADSAAAAIAAPTPANTTISPTAEPVANEAEGEAAVVAPTAEPTVIPPTNTPEPTDEPPAADTVITLATGQFSDIDLAHRGSGTATILQQGDRRVLRFTDFEVTNGPDLHVYLLPEGSTGANGYVGHIDLGELKGNVGDQNYEISADIDLSNVTRILIYCQPFSVPFSVATLNN